MGSDILLTNHNYTVFELALIVCSISSHSSLFAFSYHDLSSFELKSREYSEDSSLAGFNAHYGVDIGLSDVLVDLETVSE